MKQHLMVFLLILLGEFFLMPDKIAYTGVVSSLSTRGQSQTAACNSAEPVNGNLFVAEALLLILAVSEGATLTFN